MPCGALCTSGMPRRKRRPSPSPPPCAPHLTHPQPPPEPPPIHPSTHALTHPRPHQSWTRSILEQNGSGHLDANVYESERALARRRASGGLAPGARIAAAAGGYLARAPSGAAPGADRGGGGSSNALAGAGAGAVEMARRPSARKLGGAGSGSTGSFSRPSSPPPDRPSSSQLVGSPGGLAATLTRVFSGGSVGSGGGGGARPGPAVANASLRTRAGGAGAAPPPLAARAAVPLPVGGAVPEMSEPSALLSEADVASLAGARPRVRVFLGTSRAQPLLLPGVRACPRALDAWLSRSRPSGRRRPPAKPSPTPAPSPLPLPLSAPRPQPRCRPSTRAPPGRWPTPTPATAPACTRCCARRPARRRRCWSCGTPAVGGCAAPLRAARAEGAAGQPCRQTQALRCRPRPSYPVLAVLHSYPPPNSLQSAAQSLGRPLPHPAAPRRARAQVPCLAHTAPTHGTWGRASTAPARRLCSRCALADKSSLPRRARCAAVFLPCMRLWQMRRQARRPLHGGAGGARQQAE